jgi:MFS superfamily sulfate permease-like transporter
MAHRTFRPEFLKQDIAAGLVVFLVALPLCLGIALASGAPLMSGIITGIVGGIVVSLVSGSELSVSGPAAGLTTTLVAAQSAIGSFEGLLYATMIAGGLQVILGLLRTGSLAALFPTSVIKGMLAAIGIIIILRQVPYACGLQSLDLDEVLFPSHDPVLVWETWMSSIRTIHPGALVICLTGIALLIIWDRLAKSAGSLFKLVPGALVVVFLSVILNEIFHLIAPSLALTAQAGHLVHIPSTGGFLDLFSLMPRLDLTYLYRTTVWEMALVIALVGSIETLLSIEATDKLDPLKRPSKPNKELCAQGLGNMLAGALGGIPMTAVIVRSTANIYAGGRTRVASFVHGAMLLLCVATIPFLLNMIPLAGLASVLILVGYKLANVQLFKSVYSAGSDKFLPFLVTVISVISSDILTGVMIGTAVGLLVVVKMNYHSAFAMINDGDHYYLRFAKDVTFIQKVKLKRELSAIPNDSFITIDAGGAMFVDYDIREVIEEFRASAVDRHIEVEIRNLSPQKFKILTAPT